MVQFIEKKQIIEKILKYTQAEGKNTKGNKKPLIEDCVISLSKDELQITASDPDEAVFMQITLPSKQIDGEGEIPLELKDAITSVGRFKDEEMRISFDEKLVYYERVKGKKLHIKRPTPSPDDIKSRLEKFPFKYDEKTNTWKAGQVSFDTYIKIDADEFKEVIEDGEQVQHRSFPITVTKDAITAIVEDTDSGAQNERELNHIKIETKEAIESLFSKGFGNVFGQLSGNIEIWMANNEAMVIQKKDENITVVYVIAMVELITEEDEKETNKKEEPIKEESNDPTMEPPLDEEEPGEEPAEDYEEPPLPTRSIEKKKLTKRPIK